MKSIDVLKKIYIQIEMQVAHLVLAHLSLSPHVEVYPCILSTIP